jgi:hydrogenase nickel incorporation protein HypA/HybF
MHEMSLAGSILDIVERAAARERFRRVTRLSLEVGTLAGVEVAALRFALEAISPGTCLSGAAIDIVELPGEATCRDCARTTRLERRGEACEHCGSPRVQPTAGTALRVVDLIVADD